MHAIETFHDTYSFLSNFWPAPVFLDGIRYPTVEHAYQAAKTLNPLHREQIAACHTAGHAMRFGRSQILLRPDWTPAVKLAVMQDLLQQKFAHPHLADQLRLTGDANLIEGNLWGDAFWGVCRGPGENHLGRLLMEIRAKL